MKLVNGQVLIVGDNYPEGVDNGHEITAFQRFRRSDVFDPMTSTFDVSNWNTTPPTPEVWEVWNPTPNCFETLPGQTAVALDDGRALITGGHVPPVADMIDPCTGACASTSLDPCRNIPKNEGTTSSDMSGGS